MLTRLDRTYGCLLGLVYADALGSRLEGLPPSQLRSSFSDSGQAFEYSLRRDSLRYTDDGQMALALAEYLTENSTIDSNDLMRKFVQVYESWRGYGRGARVLIEAFRDNAEYEFLAQNLFPGGSLGNGGAMRSAPVGLKFHGDTHKIWQEAKTSAWPTHRNQVGIEGAQLIAAATSFAMSAAEIYPASLSSFLLPLCETVVFQNRLNKLSKVLHADEVEQFGNGIEAHESVVTALACFALHPNNYAAAVACAIWQGGDTDTIAAMTGALVGAHAGPKFAETLPVNRLEDGEPFLAYLHDLSKRLCEAS
jgi:poly(ADP-ribose) glycohydrolase ARH3